MLRTPLKSYAPAGTLIEEVEDEFPDSVSGLPEWSEDIFNLGDAQEYQDLHLTNSASDEDSGNDMPYDSESDSVQAVDEP